MVFSVDSETETPPLRMAAEKPHPLHNFSFPDLKWGSQRYLRCMNVDPGDQNPGHSLERRSPPSDAESADRSSPNRSGSFRKPATPSLPEKSRKPLQQTASDPGIEDLREKLMGHLRTAANQMCYKVPEDKEEEESSALRPWNLRTRRAACKAPNDAGGGRAASPVAAAVAPENSTRSRLRGSVAAAAAAAAQAAEKEKEKRKLSVSLRREEVEQDFLVMTGSKPPRRPKKRARIVQRQLDAIFPGLWLSEISPDCYKVAEVPEHGKR